MMSRQKRLSLNHKYSVSSGVFAAVDPDIKMKLDKFGQYRYVVNKKLNRLTLSKISKIDMMSDDSEDEDELSKKVFGNDKHIKHCGVIGYHRNLYIGYVSEENYRKNGTSGGFCSWLLVQLLRSGEIDGVIHVHAVEPQKNNGVLFKYVISKTEPDIKKGSKSRYYPVELSEVIKIVKKIPGKYAMVGIPEFITEARLLAENDKVIKDRVVYFIGLVCGHQKTAKYAEAFGWQYGIKPGDLHSIDFRYKIPDSPPNNYLTKMTGTVNGNEVSLTKNAYNSFFAHWPLGFFKAKFSDFTDNAFNELADVTLGDAWLPEYMEDGLGTNMLIVRNKKIDAIIRAAAKSRKIWVQSVTEETIISSQKGLIHHTVDELPYRLYKSSRFGRWVPRKRTSPSRKLSFLRRKVQNTREKITDRYAKIYNKAVQRNDWSYFEGKTRRYVKRHRDLYGIISWPGDTLKDKIFYKIRPRTRIKNILSVIKQKARIRTRLRGFVAMMRNRRKDGVTVTISVYNNFGTVIQRYALLKFLRNNGYNFDSFDFFDATAKCANKINDNLIKFTKKYINSVDFDPTMAKGYRNYVVGSDQVWRSQVLYDQRGGLGSFFLNFLSSKKTNRISYAASFGFNSLEKAGVQEDDIKWMRPLINKFSAVSVREKPGVKLVNELAGKSRRAEVVLDPTLLLDANDYSELIEKSDIANKRSPRVFCYILGMNDQKAHKIKRIAKEYGNDYQIISPYVNDESMSVEEWLKGFRDAELIIADSFHAAVFSVINKKQFIVFENVGQPIERMEEFMSSLGINKERIVMADKLDKFNILDLNKINYKKIYNRLEKLRDKSSVWLLDHIKTSTSRHGDT
jgi:coenzyme F420-reducing hydrogenase beta subunit